MSKVKKLLRKIAFPPFPANVITAGLCLALSAAVFIFQLQETIVAYPAYFLSAYGLYLLIATVLIPFVKRIIEKVKSYEKLNRYFTDIEYRSRISLYTGTAVNLGYAVFKLIVGVLIHSTFFIAIAIYYIFLSFLRFSLARADYRWKLNADKAEIEKEWKSYRRIGWMLLLMNLTLSGIIFQVVWKGDSYHYRGILIFVMALYAFYRISIVIVSLIRNRKSRSPLYSAAKILDLTVAIVAMFTLQTAMLSSFNGGGYFTALMNSITGITVSAIVLGIAVFMMVNAWLKLKKTQED